MTPQHYLDHIAADSAHFASSSAGNLDETVDHLGWSMRELVAHLGGVYAMVTANVNNPTTTPERPGDDANAPDGDAINDWFAERRTSVDLHWCPDRWLVDAAYGQRNSRAPLGC